MGGPVLSSGQLRYILVVDSDWNERFTLSMLLQRFGYTTAHTNSAREGVEFLCVAPAVAVFTEVGPVGAELSEKLKADARFRDVPLVMVAGGPDRELERRLERGEIAGLLRTPLDPDEVFKIIQAVIEQGSRRNIRIPTALPAVLRDENGTMTGYVTVLSQYGMFFRTLEPRPAAARLRASISFGDRDVHVAAEVLYVVSFEEGPFCEPGMGMKFVNISQEDSALIRFFIAEQVGGGIILPESGAVSGQA